MVFVPHEYQRFAIDFICGNAVAALLLDMGLGKTVITLTAIQELMYDRFEVRKVLVIAPLRVARDSWPAEIDKWEHIGLSYSVVVGSRDKRINALGQKADIYIINRENVEWLVCESGFKFDFDMVVIDELSSFKAHSTKRFKSLAKVRPLVKRVVGLTGTPSSNGLMDLWAQYKLLDMGKSLGRFIGNYRDEFFAPDKRNGHMVYSYRLKDGADDEIYRRIGDITISMRALDHLVMPELVVNDVFVDLSVADKKIYKTLQTEMVVELGGAEIDALNAATLSNKLCQLANGCIYGEGKKICKVHTKKLEALEDLVEGANGKPLLVAYWFKHDLESIMGRFKCREIKTSRDIADWNSGKVDIALIHPASAGHGLNLQSGGSTLVWYGLTWSLELYQQTNARLYRQGQTDTVVIHHIITKGTIDEDIIKALGKKERTQADLIEAVKAQMGV